MFSAQKQQAIPHDPFATGSSAMKILNLAKLAAVWAFVSGCWHEVKAFERNNVLHWQVSSIRTLQSRRANDVPVISGLAIHPANFNLAIVGDDHLVRILDAKTQQALHVLKGHSDWVRAAEFSPNGKLLITAGNDGKIIIWDLSANLSQILLATEPRAIFDLVIDSTGTRLATVGFDENLNIYDLESRQKSSSLICPCNDMVTVAISPDDNTLAAGGRDGIIRLWHLKTGESIRDIKPHTRRIRDLVFLDDNETLVSAGDDRKIVVTRINKVISPSTELMQVDGMIYSLAALDGNRIASGGTDNIIRIWDLNEKEQIGLLSGHTGTVNRLIFRNQKLYSAGYDTEIRIWNTENDKVVEKSNEGSGIFKPTGNRTEK